ncbi:microcin C transport system substrate-binding protein [Rhodoligotrophos appendicifer]|uniref:extracellular solute-binding protein n=1 Tax=Rhodoligotrophos appendicifer TaxID=987056 RepID=UPI001180A6EA|nr:extracellular solute-binding protein [Rhodoligotrophos appendicifer]
MELSRRWLALAMAAGLALVASGPSVAAERRHGVSTFGELKYPADFKHFEYVNPDAPKGGKISRIGTAALNTFNSLNPFILRGDPAQGMELTFDTLMARAQDEPDAMYGLVAESVEVADDKMSAVFFLRPEAKFSDGTAITAEDVVFTLETLKTKGSPGYRVQLRDVETASAVDPHTVKFTFKGTNIRDLPLTVAGLPVLSKAYYTAKPFEQTTLDAPLGSGPYKVGAVRQGNYITYERRPDYWGKDLPVNRGRYNFDQVRYEYFRDRTAELEALKAKVYLLREEFTSRDWATQYNISAVKNGQMIKTELPNHEPSGAQGFFLNMRRDKFKDPRVRMALDYAFDFEWMNKNLFYGSYARTNSIFENSPLKASGLPSAEELALLEPLRQDLGAAVFQEPYVSPVSNGSGQDRALLREAARLLDEAGWKNEGGRRVNEKGEALTIEFLMFEPTFERVVSPYVKNLRLLGIEGRMRIVDSAQYQERLKSFDFDVTTTRFVLGMTPGPEMRNFFGSDAAGDNGSNNLSGLKSPAVDALIGTVVDAKSREEMTTAARALDRVLRAEHFWVPQWFSNKHRLAYWDAFGKPETVATYDLGIVDTWWYDPQRANAIGLSE